MSLNLSPSANVLVLGGTGFIGSHLLRTLSSQGLTPFCLVHETSLPPTLADCVKPVYSSITAINWQQFDSAALDYIFHLARIPGRWKFGRLLAARKTYQANVQLLQWLKTIENPPKLIYFTGTLAYGSKRGDTTEEADLQPESYAKEYTRADTPILQACNKEKLPIMIMRPAWVYGIGSWFQKFYLEPIQSTGKVPLYGTGENWMSFIHVKDCARLALFLATQGEPYETYNLFCGEPRKQKHFAALLSEMLHLPCSYIPQYLVRLRYGCGAASAFTFSLKVATKHQTLYNGFQFQYPRLKRGLKDVLQRL